MAVEVGLTDDGEGFYVSDDGTGIPESEHDSVFETGYTTHGGGTGLGLTIIQLVALGNGWLVDVERSDEGGARFVFDDVRFAS